LAFSTAAGAPAAVLKAKGPNQRQPSGRLAQVKTKKPGRAGVWPCRAGAARTPKMNQTNGHQLLTHGWKTDETYVVNCWLMGDEGLYDSLSRLTSRDELARFVADLLDDLEPSLATDLAREALERVDWDELWSEYQADFEIAAQGQANME
jgi:hypothetical protein